MMKRRDFIKSTFLSGAVIGSELSVARGAQARGSDLIKVALVGCGNRGMGAIRQRLDVKDNMKLVALADAAPEKAKLAYNTLLDQKDLYGDRLALTPETIFTGFDAYKKAIDLCDQVLLVTTPGFRPLQYAYAVEKGKHVFLEKPCCIDAPGYRSLMKSNKIADEKGLVVVVGLQRHYEKKYLDWIEQFNKGLLGDLIYSRVYWNQGDMWERPRRPDDTEMSFQMRNWYHFVWICGDNINEQHVHNIDIGNWVHGKGDPLYHPVSVNGMGGREVRRFPRYRNSGYRWDHFAVEYTYPDGSKMISQSRMQKNCWINIDEAFEGTKGYGVIGMTKKGCWIRERGTNRELWKFNHAEDRSPQPFDQEHREGVRFIREGIKHNDGWYGATSSFTAALGRYAAYSGQELFWDDVVNNGKAIFPEEGIASMDQLPPVLPDSTPFVVPNPEDILYENSAALPGEWRWNK